MKNIEMKAERANHYQGAAMNLAYENRKLKNEIGRLEYKIESLQAKNKYLQIQVDTMNTDKGRDVAAVVALLPEEQDLVKFETYHWKADQMIAVAKKEFEKKNYELSSQYFSSFIHHYPTHEKIDDALLFQAGISAYESGKHYDWALKHLGNIVHNYPTSKFYRGAKLWMALIYLKDGQEQKFLTTVEEFRKKYRNTDEWKILSSNYEKIIQKYKR
jgi:TolA-binding protein